MPGPAPLVIDRDVARLWMAACRLATDLRQVQRAAPGTAGAAADAHTVPTLVVCLEGVVRVMLPRRNHDLQPGTAVLVPPGCHHAHAPLRRGSAQLALGFMLGRCDIELSTPERTWWLTIAEQPAHRLLERACHQPAGAVLALVREALQGLAGEAAKPVAPMPEAVERMWVYLRRERLSPITAEAVLRASGLGLTRAHLLFHAWFGETPHRLLQHHRLEYARHLLAEGQTVGAVATACGFRSRRQFTAAFSAVYGMPPSAWPAEGSGTSDR